MSEFEFLDKGIMEDFIRMFQTPSQNPCLTGHPEDMTMALNELTAFNRQFLRLT